MSWNVVVTKASGDVVPFDKHKLVRSLERAGAGPDTIDRVLNEIEGILFDGILTKTIYKTAFGLLRKVSKRWAGRYKLKNAIRELGPTGYPFERFVSALLKYQGYQVEVGSVIKGKCVGHEVDVLARSDGKVVMVECKFHNSPTYKCDVKVPLYVHSRFLDIDNVWRHNSVYSESTRQAWLVTNTRFSSDAIQYGNCVGMKMIGWDYPKQGSLKERIDISGLHPITCLSSLTKGEKQRLLDLNVVLAKEVADNKNLLGQAMIRQKKHAAVRKEAAELCSTS